MVLLPLPLPRPGVFSVKQSLPQVNLLLQQKDSHWSLWDIFLKTDPWVPLGAFPLLYSCSAPDAVDWHYATLHSALQKIRAESIVMLSRGQAPLMCTKPSRQVVRHKNGRGIRAIFKIKVDTLALLSNMPCGSQAWSHRAILCSIYDPVFLPLLPLQQHFL